MAVGDLPLQYAPSRIVLATPVLVGSRRAYLFADGDDASIEYRLIMPTSYDGGGLTIDLSYSPVADPGTDGSFRLRAAVDNRNSISDETSNPSYSWTSIIETPGSGTDGNEISASIIISSANMDSITLQDPFFLAIGRHGSDAADDAGVDLYLLDWKVRETT